MKSITFLLPAGAKAPSGGPKIVFEYSNRLVEDGHEVHIMMPMSLLWSESSLKEKVKSLPRYIYNIISKRCYPYKWFNLDKRVNLHITPSLLEFFAPKSDIYVATAIETAEYLNNYKNIKGQDKFYLIQGFENWNHPDARVYDSYRFDMTKIVISNFLQEKVKSQGQESYLVENGLDFSYFKQTIPIGDKDKFRVSMLYHTATIKGCSDGIEAIDIVRRKYPQLKAYFFGYPKRPLNLPSYVDYFQTPDQQTHNKIYNESAIFIAPSHNEGFGLTPAEAMMCGCAVVCTDNGGYAVTCKDGYTALVSSVKDPEAMAQNIIKLIENDMLRNTIAHNGSQFIKEFTWDRAYSKFKDILFVR